LIEQYLGLLGRLDRSRDEHWCSNRFGLNPPLQRTSPKQGAPPPGSEAQPRNFTREQCPETQTGGHFPSKRHRTTSKPDRYGILRENKCPATLATDLRVPENQKVSGRSELTKGSCRRTDEGRCSPPVEMLAVEVEIGEE
jgi:hypothetical protein